MIILLLGKTLLQEKGEKMSTERGNQPHFTHPRVLDTSIFSHHSLKSSQPFRAAFSVFRQPPSANTPIGLCCLSIPFFLYYRVVQVMGSPHPKCPFSLWATHKRATVQGLHYESRFSNKAILLSCISTLSM